MSVMGHRDCTTITAGSSVLAILVALVTGSFATAPWDLAVAVGKEIDFLAKNGSLVGKTVIAGASSLVGMTYDDESFTMFLSDASNRNFSIISVDLSAKNFTAKPLLKRETDSQILGMAFDSPARTLFWATERAIMKMHLPLKGAPGQPVLVHRLDQESPRDIAIDSCNGYIYWANSNRTNPSIERSRLDGTERRLLVTDDLYEPSSLAVDPRAGRLYWIDDEEGIHYKLESSDLAGVGRTLVARGSHQQPVHLALDGARLYWTDYVYSAVFALGPGDGGAPRSLRSYYDQGRQAEPTSIVVARAATTTRRRGRGGAASGESRLDYCAGEGGVTTTRTPTSSAGTSVVAAGNLTGEPGEGEIGCVNGAAAAAGGSCRCKPGYSGSKCEVSSCHNYCLRGECFVNNEGYPLCKCGESYTGMRCENDVCDGYCLNSGQCFIDNGKPACKCKYSNGVRCEITFDMAEICALYCMNRQLQMITIDTSSCRCAELNHTIEEVLGYDTFNCTILVPLLSGFIGMLTIIVIFLSAYVSKLRRRPRIKKRIVVNKSGTTPLTSRPSQLTGDQCEITIENCCNMNICETPCFEPKLCTSNSKSNGKKKEEKSGLLDHMEGGNLC